MLIPLKLGVRVATTASLVLAAGPVFADVIFEAPSASRVVEMVRIDQGSVSDVAVKDSSSGVTQLGRPKPFVPPPRSPYLPPPIGPFG